MTSHKIYSGYCPRLSIPYQQLRLKKEEQVLKVFDPLRKRLVILTPEEYVRQQFTLWLSSALHYPVSLMANEVGIDLNGMRRRCDTIVFSPNGDRLMVIEYKSPDVIISQGVFNQIVRYNLVLKAKFLVVSNGINHYCCHIDYSNGTYKFLNTVPDYMDIRFC